MRGGFLANYCPGSLKLGPIVIAVIGLRGDILVRKGNREQGTGNKFVPAWVGSLIAYKGGGRRVMLVSKSL